MAGDYEGAYCAVPYSKGNAAVGALDVTVRTLAGKALDFATATGAPSTWCEGGSKDDPESCWRQDIN